ncbi:hypothetical protein [Nioella ostreopsis]|uniref:hypothetical protein n=1 Tax=Nioella ostreopsis TaxID=2448479 RepID=UPI000FDC6FB5|nr:hypothetical protein [Nioella ostreopsis]
MIELTHLPGVIRAGAFLLLAALPAGAETAPVPSSDPMPELSAMGQTLNSAGQYSLNALLVQFADDRNSADIAAEGPSWSDVMHQQSGRGQCHDGTHDCEGPGLTGGQITR